MVVTLGGKLLGVTVLVGVTVTFRIMVRGKEIVTVEVGTATDFEPYLVKHNLEG